SPAGPAAGAAGLRTPVNPYAAGGGPIPPASAAARRACGTAAPTVVPRRGGPVAPRGAPSRRDAGPLWTGGRRPRRRHGDADRRPATVARIVARRLAGGSSLRYRHQAPHGPYRGAGPRAPAR